MAIKSALAKVLERQDLDADEMQQVMRQIMKGEATDAQIGGFLVALRAKGETVTEITAAARVMRELATPVIVNADHLVDIVGTGGDVCHTFNVSTASAFVVAAAGGTVAKHGNRAVSSSSGSADLLEAAGVNLQLSAEQVAASIAQIGLGFMFAPLHHSAMKHAIGPRKEMGVRTIFNVLGPLTNPAGVTNMLLGVFDSQLLEPMAEVLRELGGERVMVVRADDSLDEFSISAPTQCVELRDGELRRMTFSPEDFGLQRQPLANIQVESVAESLAMIQGVLANEPSAARDTVLMNAGAAIYMADLTDDMASGVQLAREVITDGRARRKLDAFVALTQSLAVQ
ncbi:MAG TPA: anthranilate phosphoribosyltransferase [Gammaproteobacteria bacterium]|jgi:anthranilate phosphoribosyltransferase|nr:anthranilate phosphoribosyltransferase [Gammaproteobacteria bacterium]